MSGEQGKRRDPALLQGGTSTAIPALSRVTCTITGGIQALEEHSTDTAGHAHWPGKAAGEGKLVSQKPYFQHATAPLLPAQPGSGLLCPALGSPHPRCPWLVHLLLLPLSAWTSAQRAIQPALPFPSPVTTPNSAAGTVCTAQRDGTHVQPTLSLLGEELWRSCRKTITQALSYH